LGFDFPVVSAAQGGFAELQGSEGVQRFCIIRVAWGEERLPQVRACSYGSGLRSK